MTRVLESHLRFDYIAFPLPELQVKSKQGVTKFGVDLTGDDSAVSVILNKFSLFLLGNLSGDDGVVILVC